MAKITVKQVKSIIGRPESQCKIVELGDTPAVRGMIAKVSHLVEIVEK